MSSWPVATESIKAHAEPAWQIGVLCVLLLLSAAAHAAPVMVVDSQSEYWLPLDADGWTVLTEPDVDTLEIYVSSSTGDDDTGDGSIGAPYATLAKAATRFRNSTEWTQQPGFISYEASDPPDVTWFSDYVYLKCGDTWEENISARNGKSITEPVLWTSYGTGARPVVNGIAKYSNTAYVVSNFIVVGIEFASRFLIYNGQYTAANWAKANHILFEDIVTHGCVVTTTDYLTIRRSILVDSYNTITHNSGLYFDYCSDSLIDECVFDHNGWHDEDPLIQGGVTNEDRAYTFEVSCAGTTVTVTRTDPTTSEVAEFSLGSANLCITSSELVINAPSGTWNLDDVDLGDVSDNFTDGDYTSSPEWTVDSGTWSAASGELINTSSGQVSIAQTDADYSGSFTCTMDSDGVYYIYLRYVDASNYVRLSMDADGMILLSKKTGSDDVSAWCTGPEPTVFNHNLYIKETCPRTTFQNNITANASATGCQMRAGGDCENNLFIDNPMQLDWGYVNGSPITAGGVEGTVSRNVIIGNASICRPRPSCTDEPRSGPIQVANVKSGVITGNVSIRGGGLLLKSAGGENITNPAYMVGILNMSVYDNIFYETNVVASGTDFDSTTFSGNTIWHPTTTGQIMKVPTSEFPEFTVSDNVYYAPSSATPFSNGSTLTYAQWVTASGETGSSNSEPAFLDEERDIESYMASLGYDEEDQTVAKFLELARANSKADWDTDFTADAVNDYIRAGFTE